MRWEIPQRRIAQVVLARCPRTYVGLLRLLDRGSLEKKAYLALLHAGDVVLDVGANFGYLTLLFSDIVGESGRVHAFEPVAPTFSRLAETVDRYAWYDNVSLNEVACTDHAGDVTLLMPGVDAGQASLRLQADGSWAGAPVVTSYDGVAITLDEYAATTPLTRIDLVKCDIEGAELLALKGMESTLRRHLPLLLVESNPDWQRSFGYDANELTAYLASLGYDHVRRLGGSDVLYAVESRHADRLRRCPRRAV